MIEMFSYQFMQRALMAGVIIAIICSLISFFIILRRLSFIGVGIAHSAFGGVALGGLLNINIFITAIIFSVTMALGTGYFSRRGKINEDTIIGMFFSFTMALGILFVGLSSGYNEDLFGYLFGSILSVSNQDLVIISSLAVAVLLVLWLFFKEFLFISFDEEAAILNGIPATLLYYVLLLLIAITVVISIKIVGIILISALLVIPAAASQQLTDNYRTMLLLSVITGIVSVFSGLALSFVFNLPSGATIVIVATIIFFACFIFSPKRRRTA